MACRRPFLLACALLASPAVWAAPDPAPSPACATPAQRDAIQAFAARAPGAPPPIGSRVLDLPEMTYVSGLYGGSAQGTDAHLFKQIWDSIAQWEGTVTFLLTAGGDHVFKFYDPVSAWAPNTRGDAFFDIKPEHKGVDGVDAHIRADLISAIYAVDLPGRGGATQGVLFFGDDGRSVFGVYAQIAGEPMPAARAAQFDETFALIAGLPPVCPDLPDARSRFLRPDTIPHPRANPHSDAKAALGRQLFFDPRLSKDNNLSCATCHHPGMGWEDGQPTGIGTAGTRLRRHTPTLENLAWAPSLFWDGRVDRLEAQLLVPLTAHDEMAQDPEALMAELAVVPAYVAAFERAFGKRGLSTRTLAEAIATYVRTIVSPPSPFDRWVEGDESAIPPVAKDGFALFVGKGRCEACHTGWRFTDDRFHDIGLPAGDDLGRFEITGDPADRYAFKTPGLRNIAQRAPFLHDGSMATLREVLDHYNNAFETRPSLSPEMQAIGLTDEEIVALFRFMLTLSSDAPSEGFPALPPAVPR